MPYTVYNLPMQRTGFRPYGHTNPWSASQLNGVRAPVWYEHQVVHPFSEGGGRRLGQIQRAFSPRFLRGLGQSDSACADFSGNFVACTDSSCKSGPCVAGGPIASEGCRDGYGNPVMCADPSCMLGGCVTIACPAGQVNQGGYCVGATTPISPGPAPRVPVSVTLFPPTAGSSTIPRCPPGVAISASGQCCKPGEVAGASGQCQSPVGSFLSSSWMPLAVVGVVVFAALAGGRR